MEGEGGGVRIAKMLILLSLKVYEFIFKLLLPFENCFPRCRFHVVTRGKEHGSHVHEASVLARAVNFLSIYVRL